MHRKILMLLAFEALTYVVAALIHAGILLPGDEHTEARIAESVIAATLIIAAAVVAIRPDWARGAGMAGQAFALLVTLVGIFTIIVGVGPQTTGDIVYHLAIVAILIWGILLARKL